jgi:hypothetical protein
MVPMLFLVFFVCSLFTLYSTNNIIVVFVTTFIFCFGVFAKFFLTG